MSVRIASFSLLQIAETKIVLAAVILVQSRAAVPGSLPHPPHKGETFRSASAPHLFSYKIQSSSVMFQVDFLLKISQAWIFVSYCTVLLHGSVIFFKVKFTHLVVFFNHERKKRNKSRNILLKKIISHPLNHGQLSPPINISLCVSPWTTASFSGFRTTICPDWPIRTVQMIHTTYALFIPRGFLVTLVFFTSYDFCCYCCSWASSESHFHCVSFHPTCLLSWKILMILKLNVSSGRF